MSKNDCEQRIAAMSNEDVRAALGLIVTEFDSAEPWNVDDLVRVHKGVLEILNEWI